MACSSAFFGDSGRGHVTMVGDNSSIGIEDIELGSIVFEKGRSQSHLIRLIDAAAKANGSAEKKRQRSQVPRR
jgi:hypothetical protein